MNEIIAGLIALAVPAFVIGSIVLWRTRPVLLMYYALVLVGLGYLTTTGAVEDVGRQALVYLDGQDKAAPQQASEPAALPPPAAEASGPQEASSAAAPAADAAPSPAPVPVPAAQPAPQP